MADPYVGEIRMFGGNFAPGGWAFCNGQLIPISTNTTLFNLIGTTYGGDGQNTFALPNLQGRVPLHIGSFSGQTFTIGELAGSETITLLTQQLPAHGHTLLATSSGQVQVPANNTSPALATSVAAGLQVYGAPAGNTTNFAKTTIQNSGGSLPHENRQPFLTVSFIISLFGIFPSPN